MTPEQLVILKAEIEGDPEAIGYAGLPHPRVADLLNQPWGQVDRQSISSGEIVAAIVPGDIPTTAPRFNYLQVVAAAGDLPLTADLRNGLLDAFSNKTATLAKLNALWSRTGTRAEVLGLPRVTPSDVANALRG